MNCAVVILLLLAADVGELKWDLSRSQRIEQVAWPGARIMNEEYEIRRPTKLQLTLPEFGLLNVEAIDIAVRKYESGQLQSIYIRTAAETLENAIKCLKDIAKQYGVELKGFEDWMKMPAFTAKSYERIVSKGSIDFSLKISPSYEREKPLGCTLIVFFKDKP